MLNLAHALEWLSADELRIELVSMMRDRMTRRAIGAADVELFCSLNRSGELNLQLDALSARDENVGSAAVRACLGSEQGRARVLHALTSSSDDDVEIARVYLQHRPIVDAAELRRLTADIARMKTGDAQVRALDALARYNISDRESLDALTGLFPLTRSVDTQVDDDPIKPGREACSPPRPPVRRASPYAQKGLLYHVIGVAGAPEDSLR